MTSTLLKIFSLARQDRSLHELGPSPLLEVRQLHNYTHMERKTRWRIYFPGTLLDKCYFGKTIFVKRMNLHLTTSGTSIDERSSNFRK